MKFFGWLTPLDKWKLTETTPSSQPVPAEKPKSVFDSILEEIHQEYRDKLETSAHRISELEKYQSELDDTISKQHAEIQSFRAQIKKLVSQNKPTLTDKESSHKAAPSSILDVFESLKSFAQKGNPVAQFHLGISYAFGVGKKKNSLLAEQWISKSTTQKNPAVFFLIASLKRQGIFLDTGLHQSLNWMKLARQHGFLEAEEFIGEIKAEIRRQEYEKASRLRDIRAEERLRKQPVENIQITAKKNVKLDKTIDLAEAGYQVAVIRRTPSTPISPEDNYVGLERDAFVIGYQHGRKCLTRAIRFNRLMLVAAADFVPRDLRAVAKRFAMRRGLLQHMITDGMEKFPGPRDLITPEVREAFIRGVKSGMT